jgi:hypothetical protein
MAGLLGLAVFPFVAIYGTVAFVTSFIGGTVGVIVGVRRKLSARGSWLTGSMAGYGIALLLFRDRALDALAFSAPIAYVIILWPAVLLMRRDGT